MTWVPQKVRAATIGLGFTLTLAAAIVVGSRNLRHFDAALVGYTFAALFATFGITYRYAMWLQRPPTRLYWRAGWRAFLHPRFLAGNLARLAKRLIVDVLGTRFIFRRGVGRGVAHWLIMWGCLSAAAITFPLVFGWIHFTTAPGDFDRYQVHVFGFVVHEMGVTSLLAFLLFHGLVGSSLLVLGGVMLAMRRRMTDRGAQALQQFGEDFLPLILLFAIAVSGLLLTASYTWMRGYAYDFLAIFHAATVILTLLWLPFGKFFHVFQRPAQFGVAFYKDVGERSAQQACARCARPFASAQMVRDLETVERQLGFRYEIPGDARVGHYQRVCPQCRRAMFGLAQGALWDRPRAPGSP